MEHPDRAATTPGGHSPGGHSPGGHPLGGPIPGGPIPDPAAIRAFLDARHLDLAARAATFAAERLAPLSSPADDATARHYARDLLALLGAGHWLDPIAAQDLRAIALTREALAAVSTLADAVFALQALAATPLLLAAEAGDSALRDRWLPELISGRAMGAFAMTEPAAGSDVAALSTSARRDGTEYVLEGTKAFISNAGIADLYIVYARTDPGAGHRGISAFAVPGETPGLHFVRPLAMSAPHPLGEIAFESCRIPAANRLGDEGAGFKLGIATLDRLRPTVGAAACGMAARALHEALAHATTREQFGQPLASFQLIQEKLARMATELTAARLLTYRAVWEKDRGAERITAEAAMAKAYATEAAQRIVDDAIQILGGRGVMADHPVDHLYRAIRALRIYEGTTEVQQLTIAGQMLKEWEARAKRSEQAPGQQPGQQQPDQPQAGAMQAGARQAETMQAEVTGGEATSPDRRQ
jgi:acyl-CoA dehydrogenase